MSKIPKIEPRGKQVLVQPDDKVSKESEYGILTPDNVEEETKSTGIVIAVGPDIKDIKRNDRVIYGAFAGDVIVFQKDMKDIQFILLPEHEILAFIEK